MRRTTASSARGYRFAGWLLLGLALAALPVGAEPGGEPTPGKVRVLVYPSPRPIDWSAPGRLVRTGAWNRVLSWFSRGKIYSIGHVDIGLLRDGEPPRYAGQTGPGRRDQILDILKGRASLDTLLKSQEGHLYERSDIARYSLEHARQGTVKILDFRVSGSTFEGLKQYLQDYLDRGYETVFGGLLHDPLVCKGAGCSAFVVSFLRLAGIVDAELAAHWQRTIRIPAALMVTDSNPRSRPGFPALLLGANSRWATPEEPGVTVTFWDPARIAEWAERIHAGEIASLRSPVEYRGRIGEATHVVLDSTEVPWNERLWRQWKSHPLTGCGGPLERVNGFVRPGF